MIPDPTPHSGQIPGVFPEDHSSTRPQVMIGCVSNVFVRQMHFEQAGDREQGHLHEFDHLTLLAHGSLLVEVADNATVYRAPAMIYIRADLMHRLTALEPDTVAYCVHGLRDLTVSEDILDPAMIPKGVHPRTLINQTIRKPDHD